MDKYSQRDAAELVALARQGDMDAFEALILQHEKIVYNIAFRMMGGGEDVKDMAQEVFLKVYRNLERFDGKSAFSTWIYRIAVNTCIDEIRKRKGKQTYSLDAELEDEDGNYKKQFADEGGRPEEEILQKELRGEVLAALETLSPEHKAAVILRDIRGYSYEEIAEMIQMPLGTVKSRISRGRAQLKEEILKIRERKTDSSRQKKGKEGRKE
nr:sigma-70 family RNA polymerase sigma factor [Anaerotignum lactatifermentans]